MPVELALSPVMRPLLVAKAMLFHPHRQSSRYIPNIIEFDDQAPGIRKYSVLKEFGTGGKVYSVYDSQNPKRTPDQRIYYMKRSTAVKGAYKFYTQGEPDPTAAIRAGLRSNVMLMKSHNRFNTLELGWHVVGHRIDAIDTYRLFELADGSTYQWTSKGKFMERVQNLGEKESEIRQRVAKVELHGTRGFDLWVDEAKVVPEMALTTAMISYIDQWNTALSVGGIYFPYQPMQLRWKRD